MRTILDAIGNTPLVQRQHITPTNGSELWLKLEHFNPFGSMKDRMALAADIDVVEWLPGGHM